MDIRISKFIVTIFFFFTINCLLSIGGVCRIVFCTFFAYFFYYRIYLTVTAVVFGFFLPNSRIVVRTLYSVHLISAFPECGVYILQVTLLIENNWDY